ncbi:hypothetical protein CLHOM_09830 [Clostridium homopropionicum DSM 5847]|uniref:Polymerase nucleotidyl transferase domain-containing protein n=1 Tax=Clostridium homopropionicum DSM 5847 TaxID=1121318 RepID=A0A0L6ZCZ0_9CLOT|nr:nucleotidyltransferase domain-containing protein [Clostridium homopropionicum]KOA20840.1 hypothetical protein CLHOM_09830 [Clostridium homopropionicum DSM 5847]SFF87769.1 Nucleotidyltransferase domain-containing protein [Clostridium homopropionicum]
MVKLSNLKLPKIDNLISAAIFGSYGTEFWVCGRSDIDILLLLQYRIDASTEFKIEDTLIPLFEEYFNYKNIHLTFIYMNEFASPFARHYIKSNDKLIIDPLKEIDFRLYVNKYIRENEWLQNRIDEDMKLLRGN